MEQASLEVSVHAPELGRSCSQDALHDRGPPLRAADRALFRAISGNKNIQHTVRYTELSPDRFKDFWR
jgi:type 1 fimbriae regulatory protein FimB/type 1 fimbriae regulatory protein FimE